MFDKLKEWAVKFFAGSVVQKAIRNGLMIASTWLMASEYSICKMTTLCSKLGNAIGGNIDEIVSTVFEVVMFVIGAFMSLKAAKAETIGKQVLKG